MAQNPTAWLAVRQSTKVIACFTIPTGSESWPGLAAARTKPIVNFSAWLRMNAVNAAIEHTMNTFTCSGFQNVKAETINEAAEIFAKRAARKKYGIRGYCRTIREDAYAQDGRLSEFSAFIGYKTGQNETSGNNISFTVSKK